MTAARPLKIVRAYEAPIDALRLLNERELEDLPATDWLVRDVVPENSLVLMYGQRSSFKSFLALDLACSISTGTAWQGRAVRQGRCVYIAGEGGPGLLPRLTAWKAAHPHVTDSGLLVLPQALSLLTAGTADQLIAAVEQTTGEEEYVALVVVDTLHRCTPGGEENSADVAAIALATADAVRRAFGCSFLFLHHPRKDGTSPRGSGALGDDVDTVIRVEREAGSENLTLHCEKQRNAPEFATLALGMRPLAGSLVVSEAGDWKVADQSVLTLSDRKVLAALDLVREEAVSYSRLKDAGELSGTTLDRALRRLVDREYVDRVPAGTHAGRVRFAYQITGRGVAAMLDHTLAERGQASTPTDQQ